MIYGSGDFIGYSWEIVAKAFREHIGDTAFSTVSECGKEFLNYLGSDNFGNENLEYLNTIALFSDALDNIGENIGKQTSKRAYKQRIIEIINARSAWIKDNVAKIEDHTDKAPFFEDYLGIIKDISKDTFECAITKNLHYLMADFLYLVFGAKIESPLSTGVVLAGYGKEQFFPELIDYKIDGKHRGFVRQWAANKIDFNEKDASTATVVPFAQSDMFQLFMEGITNDHLTFVRDTRR